MFAEKCPKIKHQWSTFETRWRNNDVGISLHRGVAILAIGEIIVCINASVSTINVAIISPFVPTVGDLARIMIIKNQSECIEEQKECVRRRVSKSKA